MRATAKLDARVREPNRRLSVEQNQCVPATGNFPRVPPLALLLPSWHAILFHLCSCRDQPSSLAYPSLAAFLSLFLSAFSSFPAANLRIYKHGWSCSPSLQSNTLAFAFALRFQFPFSFPTSPFPFPFTFAVTLRRHR